jgi:hypothetical protein
VDYVRSSCEIYHQLEVKKCRDHCIYNMGDHCLKICKFYDYSCTQRCHEYYIECLGKCPCADFHENPPPGISVLTGSTIINRGDFGEQKPVVDLTGVLRSVILFLN